MLKVFLVEDEFIIREGIRKKIDWRGNGLEFCGEAGDGELAWPLIQKEKPDIVITDIRMPFMDGLELSRLIRKELPETEIILLTGHQEFEYAKAGIEIGIARYLLKPINARELLSEVKGVADKVEERKQEKLWKLQYQKEMEEDRREKELEFFRFAVSPGNSVASLLDRAREVRLDLSGVCHSIMLLCVSKEDRDPSRYSNTLVLIQEQIEALCQERQVLFFDRKLEGYAFLLNGDSDTAILNLQEELIAGIREILSAYPQIRYDIGVGVPVNRITALPAAFEEVQRAFAGRYFSEKSKVFYVKNAGRPGSQLHTDESQESARDLLQLDARSFERRQIHNFLRIGEKDAVSFFVQEFFSKLGDTAMRSRMFRQYVVMDVVFIVMEFVEELGRDREELGAADIPAGIFSWEEATHFIDSLLCRAIELRERSAKDHYGSVVSSVKEYIEANYGDEELSLNEIAAHVNFSPNHLSMIFSQETGETLIRYLTGYRMEKARELLRCSGKKSQIIAQEVGYKDPHYFSYLFKKQYGISPTQYRNGK